MKRGSFLILGNDEKMKVCCKRLKKEGCTAQVADDKCILNDICCFENIILPLPTVANSKISGTNISVEDIVNAVSPRQKVYCGNIDISQYKNFYSYYYNDAFLINNSRLTAQGVLRLIAENVTKDFRTINAAVTGYGRCGKAICRLLKNCGMKVSSFSRRSETQTAAYDDGITDVFSTEKLSEQISDYNIIINTVPFNIFSRKIISELNSETIYIEVASKPYGFDINNTDVFNFRYILAESLPGRFTPVSAGENIAETVLSILKEEENG